MVTSSQEDKRKLLGMFDNQQNKYDKECINILKYLFSDAERLYKKLAPDGLKNSGLVLFFHPAPKQRYEEHIRIMGNINRLFKKQKQLFRKNSNNRHQPVQDIVKCGNVFAITIFTSGYPKVNIESLLNSLHILTSR